MDPTTLARRRAVVTERLSRAVALVAARFDVGDEGVSVQAPPVPGANQEVRALLQQEALAGALEKIAGSNVHRDASSRTKDVADAAGLPSQEEMQATILEESAPPAPPVVRTAGFGHADNPGPPVLTGSGTVQNDAFGRPVAFDPAVAGATSTVGAEAVTARLDAVAARAQEQAVALLEEAKPVGVGDNPGPPVLAGVGSAVDALGRLTTPGMEGQQALQDQLAAFATAGLDRRAEQGIEEGKAVAEAEHPVAGYADNPGPPVLRTDNRVIPLDEVAMLEIQVERGRLALERLDELAKAQQEAEKDTLEGDTAESFQDAARQAAEQAKARAAEAQANAPEPDETTVVVGTEGASPPPTAESTPGDADAPLATAGLEQLPQTPAKPAGGEPALQPEASAAEQAGTEAATAAAESPPEEPPAAGTAEGGTEGATTRRRRTSSST